MTTKPEAPMNEREAFEKADADICRKWPEFNDPLQRNSVVFHELHEAYAMGYQARASAPVADSWSYQNPECTITITPVLDKPTMGYHLGMAIVGLGIGYEPAITPVADVERAGKYLDKLIMSKAVTMHDPKYRKQAIHILVGLMQSARDNAAMPVRVQPAAVGDDLLVQNLRDEITLLKHQKFARFNNEECWIHQSEGENYPESLICPVVMSAQQYREFMTMAEQMKPLVEALRLAFMDAQFALQQVAMAVERGGK